MQIDLICMRRLMAPGQRLAGQIGGSGAAKHLTWSHAVTELAISEPSLMAVGEQIPMTADIAGYRLQFAERADTSLVRASRSPSPKCATALPFVNPGI